MRIHFFAKRHMSNDGPNAKLLSNVSRNVGINVELFSMKFIYKYFRKSPGVRGLHAYQSREKTNNQDGLGGNLVFYCGSDRSNCIFIQ